MGGGVDSIILRVCSGSNKGLGAKLLSAYDNLDYYKNVKWFFLIQFQKWVLMGEEG